MSEQQPGTEVAPHSPREHPQQARIHLITQRPSDLTGDDRLKFYEVVPGEDLQRLLERRRSKTEVFSAALDEDMQQSSKEQQLIVDERWDLTTAGEQWRRLFMDLARGSRVHHPPQPQAQPPVNED